MSECSLPNQERLKSTKIIQRLFAEGHSFSVYPLRVVFLPTELLPGSSQYIQVAFSVGKRKFPKAVSRNRIKRQMRECYRLQKKVLHDSLPTDGTIGLSVIFLYIGNESLNYKRIFGAMRKILKKLATNSWNNSLTDQPKD